MTTWTQKWNIDSQSCMCSCHVIMASLLYKLVSISVVVRTPQLCTTTYDEYCIQLVWLTFEQHMPRKS